MANQDYDLGFRFHPQVVRFFQACLLEIGPGLSSQSALRRMQLWLGGCTPTSSGNADCFRPGAESILNALKDAILCALYEDRKLRPFQRFYSLTLGILAGAVRLRKTC